MHLLKNFEVAVSSELTPAGPLAGVGSELFHSSHMGYLPGNDLDCYAEPEVIDRDILQGRMTPAKSILGPRRGRFQMTHELLGDSRYMFGPLLSACGFRQSQVCKIKIASNSILTPAGAAGGIMRHGTRIYYGTPSVGVLPTDQYFMLVGDYYDGDQILFGTFQQNQGKKGAGGATVPLAGYTLSTNATVASGHHCVIDTAGYVDNGGRGYYPMSKAIVWIKFATADATSDINAGDILSGVTSGAKFRSLETITVAANTVVYGEMISGAFVESEVISNDTTVDANIGTLTTLNLFTGQDAGGTCSVGVYKDGPTTSLYGCRGNVSYQFNSGKIPTLKFDLQGLVYETDGVVDLPPESGVTKLSGVPQLFVNSALRLGKDGLAGTGSEYRPCVNSLAVQIANTIAERPCSNSASGIREYVITGRGVTGTLDPEVHFEAEWPELQNFIDNVNCRLSWVVGTFVSGDNTNANNTFLFQVPRMSLTQAQGGERSGIATTQLGFKANSGTSGVSTGTVEGDFIMIVDRVPGQWSLTL